MMNYGNKIKLSKRLRMGIGRSQDDGSKFLKYAGILCLALSAVLAIRGGYMLFSDNPQAAKPNPQVLGAIDYQNSGPTPTEKSPFIEYTVKIGDTIFSIGQSTGIEWSAIAKINNLTAPFKLKDGDKLKIPVK